MARLNRRDFLGVAIGAAGATACGAVGGADRLAAAAAPSPYPLPASPVERVRLGKSGVSVSVVGIGTGSGGWAGQSDQTRLGQEAFTRFVRHSLDVGINFFDLADQYGTHPYFRQAVAGVPRDRYVIQTKTTTRDKDGARRDIDRFLSELGTDHIDTLIIHNVTAGDWPVRLRGVMDAFEEAREKGKIRAHGVTCHSFAALEAAYASDWVQVNQVRFNPRGSHMDAGVEEARALFARMRAKGQGMIGMKVLGQGDIVGRNGLTPEECFRFQLASGVVDAFVVGVVQIAQVDELIAGTERALVALRG